MSLDSDRIRAMQDAELLQIMSEKDGEDRLCTLAWGEFYRRHRDYVYGVCLYAFKGIIGEHRVSEVVQDTFVRAYEKAGTFDSRGITGVDDQRLLVRGWLGVISENIVRDSFRGQPEVSFVEDEVLESQELTEDPPGEPSIRAQRMESALEALNDREQLVLRTTALWYRPGQSQQRLPNKVMSQLANSLNTTPDNVRQIRARAMGKLRARMEALEQEKS